MIHGFVADKKVQDKVEIDPKKVSHVLLQDLVDGQEEIILELQKLNKNLAVVGSALIAMAEKQGKGKKAVDNK